MSAYKSSSSVSKPRVRQNRHKQGLNQTIEKLSADFRFHKIKRPADLSIVERLGGFLWCKGKAFIWIVQGFWKKRAEMEVVFNRCWVFRDEKCGICKPKLGICFLSATAVVGRSYDRDTDAI